MKSRGEELRELYNTVIEDQELDGATITDTFISIIERHEDQTKLGQAHCADAEKYMEHMQDFDYEKARLELETNWSLEDLKMFSNLLFRSRTMVDAILKEKGQEGASETQEQTNTDDLVWVNPKTLED